jgi:hypothetical protein
LNQPGNLLDGFETGPIKGYAVLLTPQNKGSGACTMPLTVLR